jgi:hypothetical protein
MIDKWGLVPAAAAIRVHGDPEQPTPGIAEHALLGELDSDAVEVLLEIAGEGAATCPLLFVELRQLGGALAAPPAGHGALGGLIGRFAMVAIGCPMAPGQQEAIESSLAELMRRLAPWDTGRRYLNFEERGGPARAGFAPATYGRLARIRAQWDPEERLLATHRVAAEREPDVEVVVG